jgi:hypothetical protein
VEVCGDRLTLYGGSTACVLVQRQLEKMS